MLLSVNKRFFLKNLIILLISFSLPVILLGLSTYYITQNNIKEELNKNNENILVQIKDNLEMIIDDTDSLNLTFSSNPEMIGMLKQVLYNDQHNSSVINYNSIIKDFLVTSVASRPYIYSIYIYSDNPNKYFMSSTDGLVSINNFFDNSWFESYLNHQNDQLSFWNESRSIKQYSFEKNTTDVITFYKKFFNEQGLVVLNIHKGYLVKKIKDLNLLPDQIILVLDEKNNIILNSKDQNYLTDTALDNIFNQSVTAHNLEINNEKYYITKIDPGEYKWQYVSITPLSSLYTTPLKLGKIMIIMFFISIIFCITLALIITRRTYNHVSTIITILVHAETGKPIPQLQSVVKDEYDLIIQNILKTYIEQNSLKLQLKEKHYKMRILELIALQAQINPHFLFNTLKSIFWMSFQLTNSRNEVSQMIENLSDILYYSIGKQANLVHFDEEIKNTKNYIEIEQTRYKDKFDVIWEYPEGIVKYYTIKLLIQPIVENSILHGLREKDQKGCIKIKFIELNDCLILHVTDNGVGIDKTDLNNINRKLELKQDIIDHIGIYNCNRRLSLAFGDQYGIKIRSKAGYGTSVKVILPKKLDEY